MLSLPDFKQKQILFIRPEDGIENKIRFHNENIVFLKNGKVDNRASCHKVFAVFILGNISITSELIRQCRYFGITFFFLKPNFSCYAAINAVAEGNCLLRMRQYSVSRDEELMISKNIVLNKIRNQFSLLKSRKLSMPHKSEEEIIQMIKDASGIDVLRGIEGNISRDFFGIYFKSIDWHARMPRVKPDIPNFLLDMSYTFLFNFADALACLFGFDVYKGFYHQLFFQRKSLICDIIEPFRSIMDREVLKMHNLGIVDFNDFKVKDGKIILKSFKNRHKYVFVFAETLMKNKESIYTYIRGLYRFLMNCDRNKFPYFKISR